MFGSDYLSLILFSIPLSKLGGDFFSSWYLVWLDKINLRMNIEESLKYGMHQYYTDICKQYWLLFIYQYYFTKT